MRAVPSPPACAGTPTAPPTEDGAERDRRSQTRIALGLLLAVWLAFSYPAFLGKARFPVDIANPAPGQEDKPAVNAELGDALYAFYPWHSYLGDRLRSGELPLWDPYRFAGTPFSSDIGTGTFYPPNWLYASGHVLATLTFIALASLLASLLMAFWFLRLLRLHPYAAALGAVVWTFSAFIMTSSTNEHMLGSAVWLPLALGGLEVARNGRLRRGITLTAAALVLSLLGGQVQVTLIVWLATAIWAAVGMATTLAGRDPSGSRNIQSQALAAGAAFVLALGIGAVQLLPTAQFAGQILRQETSLELALRTALPTEQLPTLLLPDYRGSPLDRNYVGPGVNYTATAIYAGILTLPLAALGLFNRPGRPALFFAVLVLLGILCITGTPFYRLILALPGFSRTVFITRFSFLLNVGLAGLAALGLHSLLVEPTRRSAAIMLGPLVAVGVVVVLLAVDRSGTPLPASYIVPRSIRAAVFLVLGGAAVAWLALQPWRAVPAALAVLAVVVVDLWQFGFPYSPYFSPRAAYARTPGVEYLSEVAGPRPRYANLGAYVLAPNAGLQYRLYSIEGYGPLIPRRLVELVSLAEDQIDQATFNFFGPFAPGAFEAPAMDLLGIRTAVAPSDASPRPAGVVAGNAILVDRPTAFPPAFLTSCWEQTTDAGSLDRLRSMSASELRGTAVLSGGRGPGPSPGGDCGSAGDATVERYEPERVVARTQADRNSVLVLTDAWYPGWSVTVDGKPADLLRVDHALRGVALSAGDHLVELRYRPRALMTGATVTALSLLFLVAWALASRRERATSGARRIDVIE